MSACLKVTRLEHTAEELRRTASRKRDASPEAAPGKPIEVWFQDAARVGQKGGHTYVWAYLRANKLCNLVRDAYDDIVRACADAWNFLVNDPQRIQSIGSRNWARVAQ